MTRINRVPIVDKTSPVVVEQESPTRRVLRIQLDRLVRRRHPGRPVLPELKATQVLKAPPDLERKRALLARKNRKA